MPYSEPSSLLPTEHGGDSIVMSLCFGSELSDIRAQIKTKKNGSEKMYYKIRINLV